jgi:hypothetical protein
MRENIKFTIAQKSTFLLEIEKISWVMITYLLFMDGYLCTVAYTPIAMQRP